MRPIVEDLYHQAKDQNVEFEIICLDDCSNDRFKKLNQHITFSKSIIYQELPTNQGRAKIRNTLAAKAKYPWLLFLDCDTGFPDGNFVKNYLNTIDAADVIVGGRIYSPEPPEDLSFYFHWKYGTHREVKTAAQRARNPYIGFMTNNFLIRKNVFDKLQFDSTLTEYGHEDTLFGQELKKLEISIKHIDNPGIHLGLETTEEFVAKSRKAIDNLIQINASNQIVETKIYDTFIKHENLITKTIKLLPKKVEGLILKNLSSSRPSLYLFDFYRLIYLSHAKNNS